MRVAFLVTYLLGIGHLARTVRIADAFAEAGHEALVISGGLPTRLARVRTARFHQLTPVQSDRSFSALFDADGQPATDALLAARVSEVRQMLKDFAPDVFATELFPLGRRKLAHEFTAAIEAAGDALILASLRDVLELPTKPGRKEEAEAYLAAHYDGILFHGGSALIGLSETWLLPETIAVPVMETGYIGSSRIEPAAGRDGTGEVLVVAGSGGLGEALFRASVGAARGDARRWRLLVGGRDAEERIAALGPLPHNIVAERTRPDFRALLSRCAVAVLQCGYNTAMDVVACNARAVFCPFEGDGETEQLKRATAMATRYGSGLVREGALAAETLGEAIATCMTGPRPDYRDLRLDGAARSVELVEAALAARR